MKQTLTLERHEHDGSYTLLRECTSTTEAERVWDQAGRPRTWIVREVIVDFDGKKQLELLHQPDELGDEGCACDVEELRQLTRNSQ